jgi:hypothetical protein
MKSSGDVPPVTLTMLKQVPPPKQLSKEGR